MGSPRTTNERGHGERLRAELLVAATELMASPRPVAVPSLRAVARTARVTPSAVYLHFASGHALATAVIAELFADLRREIDRAGPPDGEPSARLRATAHAVATWAQRRPGAYQMLFETPDPVGPEQEVSAGPGLDLLDRVTRLVAQLDHCGVPSTDPTSRRRALQIWAAVHGVVSLRLHKPHDFWVGSLHDDIDELLDVLTTGGPRLSR